MPLGRRLHWVQPSLSEPPRDSIFGEIATGSGPAFDEGSQRLLTAIFTTEESSAKPTRRCMPKEPEGVAVLDTTRAQNAAIILSKLRMPPAEMCDYIRQLDVSDAKLGPDDLELVMMVLPTPSETTKLLAHQSNVQQLRDVEQKMIILCALSKARVKMMKSALSHAAAYSSILKRCTVIQRATEEVRGSAQFRDLLHIIMKVGNFINHGQATVSKEGVVRSFALESLRALSSFKAGKISALHFLCFILQCSDQNFLRSLEQSLRHIREASNERLAALRAEVATFCEEAEFAWCRLRELPGYLARLRAAETLQALWRGSRAAGRPARRALARTAANAALRVAYSTCAGAAAQGSLARAAARAALRSAYLSCAGLAAAQVQPTCAKGRSSSKGGFRPKLPPGGKVAAGVAAWPPTPPGTPAGPDRPSSTPAGAGKGKGPLPAKGKGKALPPPPPPPRSKPLGTGGVRDASTHCSIPQESRSTPPSPGPRAHSEAEADEALAEAGEALAREDWARLETAMDRVLSAEGVTPRGSPRQPTAPAPAPCAFRMLRFRARLCAEAGIDAQLVAAPPATGTSAPSKCRDPLAQPGREAQPVPPAGDTKVPPKRCAGPPPPPRGKPPPPKSKAGPNVLQQVPPKRGAGPPPPPRGKPPPPKSKAPPTCAGKGVAKAKGKGEGRPAALPPEGPAPAAQAAAPPRGRRSGPKATFHVETAGEALERGRIETLVEVLQREGKRLREELQKTESAGAHMQVYFGAGGKPGGLPPCEETFGHINAFLCAFQSTWEEVVNHPRRWDQLRARVNTTTTEAPRHRVSITTEVAQTLGQHISSAESWDAVAATPGADNNTEAERPPGESAHAAAEATEHPAEEVPSAACADDAVGGEPTPVVATRSAPTPLRRRQRRSASAVVPAATSGRAAVFTSAVSTPRRASRPLRRDLLGPRCLALDAAPQQVPGSIISGSPCTSAGSPCKFHVIFDDNDTEVDELTESEESESAGPQRPTGRTFSEAPPCRTRAATADTLQPAGKQ